LGTYYQKHPLGVALSKESKIEPRNGWNPRIEGLRGVSILLVFFAHINPDKSHIWGELGVAIFFIISGYVITGSLNRQVTGSTQEKISVRKYLTSFYMRRATRLLPLAYLTIFLTYLVSLFEDSSDNRQYLLSVIFCVFYIGNFFGYTFGYTDLAPAIGHFWTLAVEEQFYLFWPIAFLAILRIKSINNSIKLLIIGILVIQVSHPLISSIGKTPYTLLTTHLDLILFGCLLRIIAINKIRKSKSLDHVFRVLGPMLILMVIVIPSQLFQQVTGFFYYNVIFGVASVIFLFGVKSRFFESKILRFFGDISYSLYCIHWPLFYFFRLQFGEGVISMVSVGLLSILLAIVSRRYFEFRFHKSLSTK
jgi:peptidoglycan/LPS O-acetylase OafA/YrhL